MFSPVFQILLIDPMCLANLFICYSNKYVNTRHSFSAIYKGGYMVELSLTYCLWGIWLKGMWGGTRNLWAYRGDNRSLGALVEIRSM